MSSARRIRVVDSHTAGEPTRTVIDGGPELGSGPVSEQLRRFRDRYDGYRSAVVNEPRGSDVMVGAMLTAPEDVSCAAGVIFFNNVGFLGMCGHGTIGVVTTLAYLGRISAGEHRFETPVGVVTAVLHADGLVSVQNVASYRHAAGVEVFVPGHGTVRGDVAWGGNWFFLVEEHGMCLTLRNAAALTRFTECIRRALSSAGITGRDGAEIDHIELFAPSETPGMNSRNFVLCPGSAYDRSPCGTGTSAKLGCLHASGGLAPGEIWRQESIVGTHFECSYIVRDGMAVPTISGRAWVNADSTLILDPEDPFCWGIRAGDPSLVG